MLPDDVIITDQIAGQLSRFLQTCSFSRIGILVDDNTRRECLPSIVKSVPDALITEIRHGEEHKNIDTCQQIWSSLTEAQFDRHALLINLGGGVIGDMGGFCAATYKRGIKFINIPTTLLAQVDASVGGKLGIDFKGFKNHIGVFTKPEMVYINPVFLESLPAGELRSGFAEVIKHSLIADRAYWDKIRSADLDRQNWPDHIRHSIEVKNGIVEKDPQERDLRKILNYGHTLGHAIETYFLNTEKQRVLHGEAVAAGMICEAYLSEDILGLDRHFVDEIEGYLLRIFGRLSITAKDLPEILRLTLQDKKNEKGRLNLSLLNGIGNATFNIEAEPVQLESALFRYIHLN